jgi:hypothetical protein
VECQEALIRSACCWTGLIDGCVEEYLGAIGRVFSPCCNTQISNSAHPPQHDNLPPKVKDALGVAVVKYDLNPLQVQFELTYAGE